MGAKAEGIEREADSLLCKMSWKDDMGRRRKRMRRV